jgi:hypothetical protein
VVRGERVEQCIANMTGGANEKDGCGHFYFPPYAAFSRFRGYFVAFKFA